MFLFWGTLGAVAVVQFLVRHQNGCGDAPICALATVVSVIIEHLTERLKRSPSKRRRTVTTIRSPKST
eukprot:3707113-Amphidinium_carterae.1